jgi:hypothetical protein
MKYRASFSREEFGTLPGESESVEYALVALKKIESRLQVYR